jgi:O-acetyl-ADP-ribose deacetylase (regulator of RNase III)
MLFLLHILQAVIDIRAKLNTSMNMFLDIEGSCVDLKNESGVKVERSKEGIFTITGDLSEIRAARCILINRKDEYEKRVASETRPTGATGNQAGEESSETVRKGLIPHSESNFMVTEQRRVSIEDDGGLRVHLNTVKTKNVSVKEKDKVETVSGNVEQDSRNSNSTAGGSKSVQHNSDSRMDSKAYDKSIIKSVQNEQTINPNLVAEVEKEHDLHKYTYVPPYQASNADNKLLNCPSDSHLMTTEEGVKVFVYQGDLCYINVDCIVNSSNERMDHRSGLAGVVSENAGQEMEKECKRFIKVDGLLSPHKTYVTTAGNLSHYQCVVHVCSPVWANRKTIEKFNGVLSDIVTNALVAADSKKMRSIAIPAIGSGKHFLIVCFHFYSFYLVIAISFYMSFLSAWLSSSSVLLITFHFVL